MSVCGQLFTWAGGWHPVVVAGVVGIVCVCPLTAGNPITLRRMEEALAPAWLLAAQGVWIGAVCSLKGLRIALWVPGVNADIHAIRAPAAVSADNRQTVPFGEGKEKAMIEDQQLGRLCHSVHKLGQGKTLQGNQPSLPRGHVTLVYVHISLTALQMSQVLHFSEYYRCRSVAKSRSNSWGCFAFLSRALTSTEARNSLFFYFLSQLTNKGMNR